MGPELEEGLVVGMGNPLLDITANVDNEFLEKYGLEPNNAILAEDKHKTLYEEMIKKYKVEYTAGGAVQNALRVAQWLIGKPNVTVFLGSVGKDDFSKILEDKAQEQGVNVKYQYNERIPTGTCAVLITENGNKRSLCANLAAANNFTVEHIRKSENRQLIERAKYFYISGFFLTVSPPSILEVAKYALTKNRLFIMNLSAPFLSKFFKEPLMEVMPYVDILFGNETEAETFAEEQNFGTSNLKEIALQMCQLPKLNDKRERIVIITQGHNPVLLCKGGEITEFEVPEIPKEKIIDTNGAGDAFVGGFLSQLVQGKPLETCIRCGIWTAAIIIQRSGCTFEGIPTFTD